MDYFWYPERQAGFPVRNRLRYRYEGLAPVVVPTPDKQTTDANNEKKTKQNKTKQQPEPGFPHVVTGSVFLIVSTGTTKYSNNNDTTLSGPNGIYIHILVLVAS